MVNTILIISLFAIFYSYFGYPLSLYIISLLKEKYHDKKTIYPIVSIIITAFNEKERILEKIENTLSIIYPKNKIEIIIASDGSTDGTNEIISSYAAKGIDLLPLPFRGGKESAQKEAVRQSKGEILVFTDVSTMIDPNGIEQIVSNFADPGVGCVSSRDLVIGPDGTPGGEGFYVRYEMWLRRLESRVSSLVGLSGSFFAARRVVCEDFAEDLDSDFRTLLNSVKAGKRGIIDPMAIGYYRDISDPRKEFDRKVRTVLRGITVFFRNTEFLNIFKYGLFSYQYLCHKLLRWLVPLFMTISILAIGIMSFSSLAYLIVLLSITMLFSYTLLLHFNVIRNPINIMMVPVYFVMVNLSILTAWWRYLKKERVTVWEPTKR
jgi:cellulose synthase/poly-beta-1,6-N-acetylglucosamine synthase-like glycosyltransferase